MVRPLLGPLLQREQLVGAQVALVVASARPREDGLVEILLRRAFLHGHGREHTPHVSDLFSDAIERRGDAHAPLAWRVRPHTLDEFVGQTHVLGEGSALRQAIAEDRVPSLVLYGPPGSGKTTLARIVAATTGAEFEELSAVSASVADVRAVLGRARDRLGGNDVRTILFLDEIHRFNKAQQDALLPAVEQGLVTLIGATTENPYFEVNSALISRLQVVQLEPHGEEQLVEIVRRGAAELGADVPDELAHADRAEGGRRRARGAQRARARLGHGAGPGRCALRGPRRGRRPHAARCSTTRAATATTTSRPPSSSRCAARIPTRPSSTSRRCWRPARTRATWRDA